MSQYADMLTLLDSSLSSKEFDECLRYHKLKHDCRTKGFKALEKAGLIKIERTPKRTFISGGDAKQIAAKAAVLMAKGKTIKQVADKLNVQESTLRGYVSKHRQGKPIRNMDAKVDEVIKLINDGYRFLDAARRVGASRDALRYQLKRRGLNYNAKRGELEEYK